MIDPKIELESGKDSSLPAVLARASVLGVGLDTAQVMMGYARRSTPLIGDIRVASVVVADAEGHAAELVHMPLEDLDPVTLDEQIIEGILDDHVHAADIDNHEIAHAIVAALRAGTTPKEN